MATNTENSVPVGDSAYEVSQGSSFNLLPASIPSKDNVVDLYYETCVMNWEHKGGENNWIEDFFDMTIDEARVVCEDQFPEKPPRRLTDEEVCELSSRLREKFYEEEFGCCCVCGEECDDNRRACLTDICDHFICEDCDDGCEYCPDCEAKKH